jgi:hypothetical protein
MGKTEVVKIAKAAKARLKAEHERKKKK